MFSVRSRRAASTEIEGAVQPDTVGRWRRYASDEKASLSQRRCAVRDSSIEGEPPPSGEPHGWGISIELDSRFQRAPSPVSMCSTTLRRAHGPSDSAAGLTVLSQIIALPNLAETLLYATMADAVRVVIQRCPAVTGVAGGTCRSMSQSRNGLAGAAGRLGSEMLKALQRTPRSSLEDMHDRLTVRRGCVTSSMGARCRGECV